MSVKQTYTLTRPNTGVDWYPISEKFHKLRGKYDKAGKRRIVSKIISNVVIMAIDEKIDTLYRNIKIKE